MPIGHMVAQTTHAAGESAIPNLPSDTHAVVLGASEQELQLLEAQLQALGIPHSVIREPDPPYLGAVTAIGIQPMERERIRKLLSKFPLIK